MHPTADTLPNLVPLEPNESRLLTFGFEEMGFKPLGAGGYWKNSCGLVPCYEWVEMKGPDYSVTCEIYTFAQQ